jgi:glycosyltransferase involved in cell wall biosynthesis
MRGWVRPMTSQSPNGPPQAEAGRFAFVIPHLGAGGAQRVLTNAANQLAAQDLGVHIVALFAGYDEVFELDPAVAVHRLGFELDPLPDSHPAAQRSAISAFYGRAVRPRLRSAANVPRVLMQAVRLRRVIREIAPEAIVSFLTTTNILVLMATRGLGIRTIVSERNDPRLQRNTWRVDAARRLLYRRADLVTANTVGALEALASFVPKGKLALLPNILASPPGPSAVRFQAPTFICVARLVEQKGVDILIEASAKALQELPNWRLAILGDGPLRGELEALAGALGIAENIDWLGHVPDPYPYLCAAEFFILTSRFEGTPNALLEAMSSGLPAIVTDASPGPLSLIGNGEAGLIVPAEDVAATAWAIVRLATDTPLRMRLAGAARERAAAHHPAAVLPVWRHLLRDG